VFSDASLFVKVSNVLLALQAGSRGTQACINAASTVSGIIGDLDTTIMFATAGSLNADNEELFSDHRWANAVLYLDLFIYYYYFFRPWYFIPRVWDIKQSVWCLERLQWGLGNCESVRQADCVETLDCRRDPLVQECRFTFIIIIIITNVNI